jgi:hypothetical protein
MNDQVHASPNDIRRLAAALTGFKREVDQAMKRVRGALAQANWHDSRKARFEGELRDLAKRVDGFMTGEIDDMVKDLTRLAAKLDEIRNVRM